MAKLPPKKKLRSGNRIYLIDTVEHQIVGSKLPSKRQVLQVLFYNKRVIGLSTEESARLVIDEVLVFWQKARISTSAIWYCVRKLLDLYGEWYALQKNLSKKSEKHKAAETTFVDELDNLSDIAASNALQTAKNETDKEFLIAQRKKDREGCMLGIEQKLQTEEQKGLERITLERESEERIRKKADSEKQKYQRGISKD